VQARRGPALAQVEVGVNDLLTTAWRKPPGFRLAACGYRHLRQTAADGVAASADRRARTDRTSNRAADSSAGQGL